MDLARQLKQGIITGTVLFGQRQTTSACTKGDARLVPVSYTTLTLPTTPAM